jgi:hypothetical protein
VALRPRSGSRPNTFSAPDRSVQQEARPTGRGFPLHVLLGLGYGFGTPGKSASPIVGMNCGGTRMCVACSKSYA